MSEQENRGRGAGRTSGTSENRQPVKRRVQPESRPISTRNLKQRDARRRRRRRMRRLKKLLPLLLVIAAILVIAVIAVVLSFNQSKSGKDASKPAATEGSADANGGTESSMETETDGSGADESEEEESGTGTEAISYSHLPSDFDEFTAWVLEELGTDPAVFETGNSGLSQLVEQMKVYDTLLLTEEQQRLCDVLNDYFTIQQEGEQYTAAASQAGSGPLRDVTGGLEYYEYLVNRICGTDTTLTQLHTDVSEELNQNFATINAISQSEPDVYSQSAAITKQEPDTSYQYDTVTASSDELLKLLACEGLESGWKEFGIIRAYQLDETLSDSVKNYMIASVRTIYALYGMVDLSVHMEGWTYDDVLSHCNDYFGGDQSELARTLYDRVIASPGEQLATVTGYLELVKLEQVIQQTSAESESLLFQLLFEQGPASFRVLSSWQ